MMISDTTATLILSLIGSAVMMGIAWGAASTTLSSLKDKMAELQKNFDSHVEDNKKVHDRFVTQDVFKSVISPIHNQLASIQGDIKDLIKLVTQSQARRE